MDVYFSVALVLEGSIRLRILPVLLSYAGEDDALEEVLEVLMWRCAGMPIRVVFLEGDLHLSLPGEETLSGGARMVRVVAAEPRWRRPTGPDLLRADLPLLAACRWIRGGGQGDFVLRARGEGGLVSWVCEWDLDSYWLHTRIAVRGEDWESSDDEA